MWLLASAFLEIALHRRGPDQLPASQFLLVLLLGLYVAASIATLGILGVLGQTDLTLLLLDSGFFLAFVFVTLRLFRRERRFVQTATALVGTDVVLSVIGLPLALWARALAVPADAASAPMLLRLLLLLWWVDVAGFILSRALSRPYIVGILFVLLYVMVSLSIRDFLAPAGAQ